MSEDNRFVVVSYYADGDHVIEGSFPTRAMAHEAVGALLDFRDDQDEMPQIVVEDRS